MEIVDNKLFTISPGRGFLDVGQSCCVTLTYDHLIEGQHVLPIILKIKHGNEVKVIVMMKTMTTTTMMTTMMAEVAVAVMMMMMMEVDVMMMMMRLVMIVMELLTLT